MTDTDMELLDLDAASAARREGGVKPLGLRFKGDTFTLPAELPLDVFEPLVGLDLDLALLLRQVMDVADATSDAEQRKASTSLIVDLLVNRPTLPKEVVEAIGDMARRLFDSAEHPDQWAAFMAKRPTKDDLAGLAKGLFKKYGVSLGEASGSTESSGDAGPTSSATSSASTDSTPAASGKRRAPRAS